MECNNHKPQPFPDTKRKRKLTRPNTYRTNVLKNTKISSLFPERDPKGKQTTLMAVIGLTVIQNDTANQVSYFAKDCKSSILQICNVSPTCPDLAVLSAVSCLVPGSSGKESGTDSL